MAAFTLKCTACAASHDADVRTLECWSCQSPLVVDYSAHDFEVGSAATPRRTGPLPVPRPDDAVSLGEGGTPMVELKAVADSLGLDVVRGKLEYINPTGSFKDRGTAVMISVAREQRVTEVVEDSSGNAGASVAAYAARAGMKAHIFAPSTAPEAKLRQIRAYGAEVHAIEGPREATTAAAVSFYKERDLVYASHVLSPFFLEGTKSFAYELAEDLSGNLPGHIVFPVGTGSLFLGAWIGFAELKEAGRIASIPKLHCAQAEGVMPIVAAFEGREAPPVSTTVAGGIAVASPARLQQIIEVLQQGGGAAVSVSDSDILGWQTILSKTEGIYGEPTSAAAFAGLQELMARGVIRPSDSVVVPVTGFGLKDVPAD